MEDQWKSKEANVESRTRDILKATKLNESLIGKLEKERKGFEVRVKDLEEMLESRENDYNNNIAELQSKLDQSEKTLSNLRVEFDRNEKKYNAVRERLVKIEIHQKEEAELNKKRKLASRMDETGGVVMHTLTEVEIWNELQATKVALKAKEERLKKLQTEKDRFLETVAKVTTVSIAQVISFYGGGQVGTGK